MVRSAPSQSFSTSGGRLSRSSTGSVGFGSHWVGGGIRPSYGYSLGTGLAGGLQSHAGLGLGSGLGVGLGAGGSRFGSGLAVGGGSLGLGLASGGGGGGGRFGFGWAAGGGGGGAGAGFWAGGSSIADGGLHPFTTNEKLELQTLNDRLAAYLDKVKRLETANQELEEKLRGFKANKVQVTYDFQAYQKTIQPLRDQLADIVKECSRLTLTIDNTRLAADNFRVKYENEHAVRQMVENDVSILKALKKELDMTINALTQEYQTVLKDRDTLQSTHQQEVLSLRGQVAGTLTVKVQADESGDLSRGLADLRAEYETIVKRNHSEIEDWYATKLKLMDQVSVEVTDVTVSGSTEISASQGQVLTLQTELDTLLLKKTFQEQQLVDAQGQKQVQLLVLNQLAGGLESELALVRESALQQARDYQLLLSTKVQLEKEIATYKTLLEGAGDLSKIIGLSRPPKLLRSDKVLVAADAAPSVSTEVAAAAGKMEASADLKPSSESVTALGVDEAAAVRARSSISSPFDAFLE